VIPESPEQDLGSAGGQNRRRFRVHGYVLAADRELPVAPAADGRVDLDVRLTLGRHDRRPRRHSRPDNADPPWSIVHWLDVGYEIEFPDIAAFTFSERHITLVEDLTGDDALVAHLVLDHVLPKVIALRGDTMVHGSGNVGPSGGAHVFVAPSGTGKSTCATALARHGWPLLDDDGVRLMANEDHVDAVPGLRGVRLLPDSAAAVLPGATGGPPMSAGHPKRRFGATEHDLLLAQEPSRLAAVYLLDRSQGERARVEPLRPAEALAALVGNSIHMHADPTRITAVAFERAGAIIACVRPYRLVLPDGLDALGQVVDVLAANDRRLGAGGTAAE